jgi:hypothetical protein
LDAQEVNWILALGLKTRPLWSRFVV